MSRDVPKESTSTRWTCWYGWGKWKGGSWHMLSRGSAPTPKTREEAAERCKQDAAWRRKHSRGRMPRYIIREVTTHQSEGFDVYV